MTVSRLLALASVPRRQLDAILVRLAPDMCARRRGRPWSCSLRCRVLLTCVALRTNLTFRELALCASISSSTAHRIVAALTPVLAKLLGAPVIDRRVAWVVDGTLIPTRDHACAAKAKNYRYSCNAQILIQQRDLRIVATFAGGPGNRNDPVHYRGSPIEALCQTHAHVLADGGLPRHPRAHHSGVSGEPDRAEPRVAATPSPESPRRACDWPAQDLACPP